MAIKALQLVKISAKSLRFFAALTVATMVGGFATAMVIAAIPHSNTGIISGCYNDTGGNLRIIDAQASEVCANNETPISWGSTVTISKRATFAVTDPVTTLAVIPGYGELIVDPSQCNADSVNQAPIDYKNTTASTLVMAGPGGWNMNPIAPDNEYRIGVQVYGYGNDQYFLSADSSSSQVVSIRVAGYEAISNPGACTYYAHVTYNQ